MIVKVQGPMPENILFHVHEVFEGLILESYRGVHYDFTVPCPDCLKQGLKDPHMFLSSTIRRAIELKAPFLQCMKYFHTISIVDLQSKAFFVLFYALKGGNIKYKRTDTLSLLTNWRILKILSFNELN